MRCPCRDCADRHEACHDRCEKYKEWRVPLDKAIQDRIIRNEVYDIMVGQKRKMINRKHRRGK